MKRLKYILLGTAAIVAVGASFFPDTQEAEPPTYYGIVPLEGISYPTIEWLANRPMKGDTQIGIEVSVYWLNESQLEDSYNGKYPILDDYVSTKIVCTQEDCRNIIDLLYSDLDQILMISSEETINVDPESVKQFFVLPVARFKYEVGDRVREI